MDRRILIVSEDSQLVWDVKNLLSGEPVEQTQVRSGQACLDMIVSTPVDIAVIDNRLQDMQAVDLIRNIKSTVPDIIVILAAYKHSIQQEIEARRAGAFYCIIGPGEYDTLYQFLLQATALESRHLLSKHRRRR